jgi:eukaryotic-like serine/threonine-protein kinase
MSDAIPAAKRNRTAAGEFLHGYRVRKWLGDGAFSVVYLVEDSKTRVQYALKHVVSEGDKEDRYLDQLRMEWEVGRRLKHRNIREIVDLRGDRGVGFLKKPSRDLGLVMEMIDAPSLEDMLQKGEADFTIAEWIAIFRDVASALVHIHDKGYAHADMKPNNVLWDEKHTKVIDLGQAWKIGTAKPRMSGTAGYVAPEQPLVDQITPQTDVFNFGATMYRLLRGKFAPQTVHPKYPRDFQIPPDLLGETTPLMQWNPQIPEKLSDLVLNCLELEPAKRKYMTYVLKQLDSMVAVPAAK